MAITISDDLLQAVHMSDKEFLVDLACYLYDKEKLSFGKASKLSELNHLEFQQALAARDIYLKYDMDDYQVDLKNLGITL